MPLSPGQVVKGQYRIERLLGQGGFGAVYYVWDENLDRPCALKENLEISEKNRRQFTHEARILARLNHPNLPRVTDYFLIPDQGQYLVMDYVDGEDLEKRRQRLGGPFEEAEALNWIEQVCDALHYLHRQDPPIIHRDIKPANIRITPQGKAMLVDFGIAKLLNPDMRTTIGARAFTPGYSPPEQYGRGSTDERSDVFALGATLYTLLTGSVPPESVDVMTGNAKPAPPAHRVNPKVSPAVSQAIQQAMSPGLEGRFANVEALRQALRRGSGAVAKTALVAPQPSPAGTGLPAGAAAIAGAPAGGGPGGSAPDLSPSPGSRSGPSVVVPVGPPASKPRSRRPLATVLAMALGGFGLALLGGVALIWLVWQFTQNPGPAFTATAGALLEATVTAAPAVAETSSAAVAPATHTPLPTEPTLPSETPTRPPAPGALLAQLPGARLAFVSDHAGDGRDAIYVLDVSPGAYWFSPKDGGQYGLDTANPAAPFSDPIEIPNGDDHNLAWWPEWCAGNSVLMFEAQDTRYANFQTLYSVDFTDTTVGKPVPVIWEGFSRLGVPRCAHRSRRAVASGEMLGEWEVWRTYTFDLDNPSQPRIVGDGFATSGFASWSADDAWLALMQKPRGSTLYEVYVMDWAKEGQFVALAPTPGETPSRFPAISPLDGAIAFACPQGSEVWGLCLQQRGADQMTTLLDGLGPINSPLRSPKPGFSTITPSWSPDGRWLAFSSNLAGDWDIYLYHLETKMIVNLTRTLGASEQFHPMWSKP